MLSRTADHLYWMARYTERAENTARMLDINYQMSMLPQSSEQAQNNWRGLLSISELTGDFHSRHPELLPADVMDYMLGSAARGEGRKSGRFAGQFGRADAAGQQSPHG